MERQKVYGDNQVFCKGRFIAGPDARSSIATLLMISIPSAVWQVDVGTFMAKRGSSAVMLFMAVLQCASLGLLLATALSDPGIVPRQASFTEQYDAKTQSFRMRQPPKHHDLVLRGHNFKLKYCTTCHIYRPPRCTHCSVCENCVERFDHHCPWLGNCVGRRNYRLFFAFVVCTATLNVVSLATAVAKVTMHCRAQQEQLANNAGRALLGTMAEVPVSVALVVYTTAVVWFTVGLVIFHSYLISSNQTTYEQVKGVYCGGSNPFDRGAAGNFRDALCSPVRPRYFDALTGSSRWPTATKEGGT